MKLHETRNGCLVEFGQGSFDDWCVYLTRPGSRKYAPRDPEYFEFLRRCALTHSTENVYRAFLAVFAVASRTPNPKAITIIQTESLAFAAESDEMEVWLSVMWGGMIAEENKAFSRLGKRIKHLGVHQVLVQGLPVLEAANWSRGKKWRDIAGECERWNI
jgi:hypothetical protein